VIDPDAEVADDLRREAVHHRGIDERVAVGVDRLDRPCGVPRHEFDAPAEQLNHDGRNRQIGQHAREGHG
jgi:hypothetical protein